MVIREAAEADAEAIALVHVDAWRETYAGIIPDEFLASLSYEQRTKNWKKNLTRPEPGEYYLVAEDERDGIIGFAASGPEREGNTVYTGELYAVYLRKVYTRRGIGRRLAAGIAEGLIRRGHRSMLVWVLRNNPAGLFYVSLGGERIGEKTITLGGKDLKEEAYGWKDLSMVPGRTAALNLNGGHATKES